MLGFRQLLLLALIAAGFWLWRRWRRRRRAPSPRVPVYRETVRCAYCGIHIPKERAVGDSASGGYYCSEQHRLAHRTDF
ncbi:MAG TPA: PP0621 family protein [Candidatus Competibacteraceae bacterium]|nr:PP0621 family protein [Candidatus Competibacteraceae bacterium]